jgi:hypothetical protein
MFSKQRLMLRRTSMGCKLEIAVGPSRVIQFMRFEQPLVQVIAGS